MGECRARGRTSPRDPRDRPARLTRPPSPRLPLAPRSCNIIHRAFPTGDNLPDVQNDPWVVEAMVSYNLLTIDVPTTGAQIGIGLYDTGVSVQVPSVTGVTASAPVNTSGGLHFFQSLKFSAATTTVGGYEALNSATPLNFYYATSQTTDGLTGTGFAWFRFERSPDETKQTGVNVSRPGYGSWRFGVRYDTGWVWGYSSWLSDATLLRRNRAGSVVFNAATSRIALVGVSTSTSLRMNGEIRYVRFGRPTDDAPGPVLQVSATTTGSTVTTQTVTTPALFPSGTVHRFKASGTNSLGTGPAGPALPVSPGPGLAIPYASTVAWNPATLIEVGRGKTTGGVDAGGIQPSGATTAASGYASRFGVDGIIDTVSINSNFVNMAAHTPGSWWYVDLGILTSVKEIAF